MAKLFENVQVGDQLELPARRAPWGFPDHETRDPERPIRIGVVTYRWLDPFEQKEYVAVSYVLKGGMVSEPKEKRTIRGLAQAGWRFSKKDWISWAKAVERSPQVVQLSRK